MQLVADCARKGMSLAEVKREFGGSVKRPLPLQPSNRFNSTLSGPTSK